MQDKTVLHLFIPSLLQPLKSWYQDYLFEVETPYLSLLLSNYTVNKSIRSQGVDSAFFKTINPTVEELPIAFYRHQVQKNDIQNGLICADPVHFEVGMKDVTLTKKITDLTELEAKELIEMLNEHFAEDGLRFVYGSNQCWYVLSNYDETFSSYELDSVLMQNITAKLAISEDRNWQIIQNETQMLLHSSEINQQREMAGLDSINSLWFWGAGKPNVSNYKIQNIFSSSASSSKLRGELFAKAANCEWQVLPQDFNQCLNLIGKSHATQVILLDQLFIPAVENNLDDFKKELSEIDSTIIKPLLNAWKNKEIEVIIDCCDGVIFRPETSPFWKFHLKPKKLRDLLDEINP